ncbi:hypothetical protein GXW83_21840 [Streptacidiphilus sp. PB12-B1b]|uniref:WXG100-like domain-containing protein n=1 Tax=Streptacidiphilus sp. PB12-B1b TaxID=2705012 RepID=UPI0015FCCD53|nr:hypothetical protein [Streptacidiphilus sp. PB12-B1b]QMU77943.1 hypothetical protein GXW83_21840 [Streptacidiphilus sp. PB12-B1b]
MDLQLPTFLQDVAKYVAGAWPKLSETETRTLGATASSFGDDLGDLSNDVTVALAGARGAVGGQGGAAFDAYIAQMSASGPQALAAMQQELYSVSDGLNQTALAVETAKLQIIEMLAWLLAELLWAAAMAPFTAGASEAAVPAMIEATQSVVISIGRMALQEIAKGAAMMGGMDMLTQLIEMAKGDRSSFDFKETLESAGMGALAGAIGAGFGLGGSKLMGDFSHTFTGKVVNGVVVGGASNYVSQIVMSGIQGQVDFNYLGFVNGAAGGAIGTLGHGLIDGAKNYLGPGSALDADVAALLDKGMPLPETGAESAPETAPRVPEGFAAGSGLRDAEGSPLWVQPNAYGSYVVHSGGDQQAAGDAVDVGAGDGVRVGGGQGDFLTAVQKLPDTLVVGTPDEVPVGPDGQPVPVGGLGGHLENVWSGVGEQLPADASMPIRVLLTSPVSPADYPGLQAFADGHGVDVLAPDGTVQTSPGGLSVLRTAPGTQQPTDGGWHVISPTQQSSQARTAATGDPSSQFSGQGGELTTSHSTSRSGGSASTPYTPPQQSELTLGQRVFGVGQTRPTNAGPMASEGRGGPVEPGTPGQDAPRLVTTAEQPARTTGSWERPATGGAAGSVGGALPEARAAQGAEAEPEAQPAAQEQALATATTAEQSARTTGSWERPATSGGAGSVGEALPGARTARGSETEPEAQQDNQEPALATATIAEQPSRTTGAGSVGEALPGARTARGSESAPEARAGDQPEPVPSNANAATTGAGAARSATGRGLPGPQRARTAEAGTDRPAPAPVRVETAAPEPGRAGTAGAAEPGRAEQGRAEVPAPGSGGVRAGAGSGPGDGSAAAAGPDRAAVVATDHGVWFPRRDGSPLQRAAAHAVPGAEGWQLFVGHGEQGAMELDGRLVGADAVLAHDSGAAAHAFISCYAAKPGEDGSSLALAAHLASGKPTLGPTREAIVTTDGDVISGVVGIDTASGRPVVRPDGDWTVYENGVPRSLGTASLKQAWSLLGARGLGAGPAPHDAVGFVHGITDAQSKALNAHGYAPVRTGPPAGQEADSFVASLREVANTELTRIFGTAPTEVQLRAALHDALRDDLTRQAADPTAAPSSYGRFLAQTDTVAGVLNDLATRGRWSATLGVLAPHLAADLFRLDLGVVGVHGIPERLGQVTGPHHSGQPLLLARVGESHFVPAQRDQTVAAAVPVPTREQVHPLPIRGQGRQGAVAPSVWNRELTKAEQARVRQSGQEVLENPAVARQLVQGASAARLRAVRQGLDTLLGGERTAVNLLTRRALEGDDQALDELERLENVAARHQQLTSTGPLSEQDQLTAFQSELAGGGPVVAPDPHALTVVRARAYHDLEQQLAAEHTALPQGIRARIGQLRANAAQDQETEGEQAAQQQSVAERAARPLHLPDPVREDLRQAAEQRRNRLVAEDPAATQRVQAARDRARNAALDRHAGRVFMPDIHDRLTWAKVRSAHQGRISTAHKAGEASSGQEHDRIADPVRRPAETAAAWRIRTEAARLEQLQADPPRQLPPGFAETDATGAVQGFPLGYRGRVMRLGDVWFGDNDAMADLVRDSLPAAVLQPVRDATRSAVRERLVALGNRASAQRMLEGGLRLPVRVGRRTYDVNVRLDLGSDAQAHYLPSLEAQRDEGGAPASQQTVFGQKHHGAVESDHENIAGTRITGSNSRSFNAAVNVVQPFGELPRKILSATAELNMSGDSSQSWAFGNDGVSATKRFLDMGGQESRFHFGDAELTVSIGGLGSPEAPLSRTVSAPARLGFPKELTPEQPAGGGPILPTAANRPGAGAARLGLDDAQIASHTPADRAVAERVHSALHQVMHIPESISGLERLRRSVIAGLPNRSVQLGSELYEGIQHWISEPNLLRNYGDLNTVGTLSPSYRTADGDARAHLNVVSRMLRAERVSDSAVPMKEESQRWVNTNSSSSDSGGVGITPIKGSVGYTVGDPEAAFGLNHSVGGGFSLGMHVGSTRTTNENTGAGEVRGLVYNDHSRLYRLTTRMSVHVSSDMRHYANRPDALAEEDVTTFVRVPLHEAARFEALIARETAGDVGSPAWLHANTLVPRDRDVAPNGQGPAQVPPAQAADRFPPVSVEANQGIGFSAIGRLSGAEKILPQIEGQLKEVEASRSWAPGRGPMEASYLRRQLLAKFSKEALINRGSALFQPGGVKEKLYRPVGNGTEVITIEVKAVRSAQPTAQGRVTNAKLELMPAGFAGHGGNDSLSASSTLAFNFSGTAGIGRLTKSALRQFGPSLEVGGTLSKSDSSGGGSSGFQLQAMLYGGAARTFDYDVTYQVKVGIKHVVETNPTDWPALAYRKLRSLVLPPAENPLLATIARERSVTRHVTGPAGAPHQVRLVVPEELTHTARPDVTGIGTRVPRNFRGLRGPQVVDRYTHSRTTLPLVRLPDIPAELQRRHTPLNGDDVVMETIGAHHVEAEVVELLNQVGISPDRAGDIAWAATGTEMLTGAQVRGPSPITATFVRQGLLQDGHTVVRIEGFPLDGGATPLHLQTLKMDVAEGGSNVSGSDGWGRSSYYKVGVSFGAAAGTDHGGQSVFPGLNRQGDLPFVKNKSRSSSTTLGPVSGRLTQLNADFTEHRAHMLYRVTVITQKKNVFGSSTPRVASGLFEVNGGIRYLRATAAPADPHTQALRSAAAPAPNGRPTLIRTGLPHTGAAADARPRRNTDLEIDTFPATPEDLALGAQGRKLGVRPLVPHAAASERLIVPPGTARGRFEMTGQGNPLVDSVQSLLQRHAPGVMDDHWQIADLGVGVHRPLPTKLSTLLNTGSSEALLDTLLGPGLILHTTDPGVLHNDRIWLLLRATRDPNNNGYYYLEDVNGATTSRYHFRLNADGTSRSVDESTEWSSSTRVAESPDVTDRFNSITVAPGGSISKSASEGDAVSGVDASRNTLFVGGPTNRYAGDLAVDVTVIRTANPSRLANSLLTIPDKVMLWYNNKLDMSRADGTARVMLTERVQIPEQLQHPPIEPYTPLNTHVAVSEVDFGATAATLGTPLGITKEDLLDRKAFNLGFDHDKLRVLSDEVLKRLAGNTATRDNSADAAVKRMVAHGSRSRDAIFTMLSHPMMTNELELAISDKGLVSPTLVREGGLLTDTHAVMKIEVEPFDGLAGNHFTGGLESNSYRFVESSQNKSDGEGWGFSTSVGLKETAGSMDPKLPPGSHDKRNPQENVGVGFGQRRGHSSFTVHKDMRRVISRNRNVPWLTLRSDAVVRITVTARNRRGPIDIPGGTTRMAFHVRHGLEFAVSPELALQRLDSQALHQNGTPTPSGVFIPAKGHAAVPDDGPRQLQAAYSFPTVGNALVVHVHNDPTTPGNFVVGNASLTPTQFDQQVLTRHNLQPGQALVLVGCDAASPVGTGPSPAEVIAANHGGVHVIATSGQAVTTPDGAVLAGRLGAGPANAPLESSWQPGQWTLFDGAAAPVPLGSDLVGALRQGLGPALGQPANPHPVADGAGALPPVQLVTWGASGSRPPTGQETPGDGRLPSLPLTLGRSGRGRTGAASLPPAARSAGFGPGTASGGAGRPPATGLPPLQELPEPESAEAGHGHPHQEHRQEQPETDHSSIRSILSGAVRHG